MRLSKIKLAGFKSFVDPTTVPFPSNLTGIVGPNGCGKSNIIDAVRWVMGESSAKNLRGDAMTDVIFNGSSSRKPVGQASIELIFDNSDATISGQFANYNEIAIKRQVSRDGQSLYFLNGARCRRRDITDIFLGTGLGPRSYAIIEQGTISRLIEAKPDELRVFLEEAAGISKYKERRRETETRMRHTRENLERLNDIREELDKQLNHLQRQARTAERYKELKQDERLVKGQLHALHWDELSGDIEQQEKVIREQETKLESFYAEQRHAEAEIETKREAHLEASDNVNSVQTEFYSIGADIARLEQSIQHETERYQQQRNDLDQIERNWNESQSHLYNDRKKRDELKAVLDEIEPHYNLLNEQVQSSRSALEESEAAMRQWQSDWESFNQRAAEPAQIAQVERARIQQHEQNTSQLEVRVARINDEMNNLSTSNLEQELMQLREQVGEMELQQQTHQEQLDTTRIEIDTARERLRDNSQLLNQRQTDLQSLRGRHASLEALQQAALGKGEGDVAQWLSSHQLENSKRLAEGISVESGWEKAVESVLGECVEAICVDGLDPVAALIGDLKHGSATLLEVNASSTTNHDSRSIYSKIKSDWDLQEIIGDVLIADDLNTALQMRSTLQSGQSVITRDGLWIGRNWLKVHRDSDNHSGVLAREKELAELNQSIAELEQGVEELTRQVNDDQQRQLQLEQQREQLQLQLNDYTKSFSDLKTSIGSKESRLEQITARRERLQHDTNELKQNIAANNEEMAVSRSRLHQAIEEVDRLANEREVLQTLREEITAKLESSRIAAQEHQEESHRIQLQYQTSKTEFESLSQSEERAEMQMQQLAERREMLKELLANGDEPILEKRAQLEEMLSKRMAVEERLQNARKVLGDIDHAIRENENRRNQAERKISDIRSELESKRMRWQERKVRRQTIEEQIVEHHQSLDELKTSLPEGASIREWEQRVEQLANQIQRLGPINLAAISEYDTQLERKTYLDSQNDDLTQALEVLENAIRKIDKETRTRFKDTFENVNKGLQEKFPRLFGGGHAYLELTGDDLLDTGVSVMARPPGKRNSSIHLLSGGEKALTAVALVFAIFELNPSPFCMLDEVDAPLDEANVGRFCKLVEEMSERVQFIFITHNKTTMELSSTLSGVTMHEPGVSRMVQVDVDGAVELAAV